MDRRKNIFKFSISLIIIFVIFPAFLSYGANNFSREHTVRSLTAAQAPLEDKESLILTFQAEAATRYVGAVFAHEDYQSLHLFTKNENGVFYLVYPIPCDYQELQYRLVVDGIWMKDPSNSLFTHDYLQGIDFSLIKLSYQREKEINNPAREGTDKLMITFRGESGSRINLIGDFNSWDPYAYPLRERADKPGYYTISFSVRAGRHYYLLLVDGKEIVDPCNFQRIYDGEARLVNYFDFPQSP